MDVGRIRPSAARIAKRPMGATTAACALLAVPILWNAWQSRLTQQAIDRAAAAEKARADADPTRPRKDGAVWRSRHDDPRERERVKELYREIEDLTHIQEEVQEDLETSRRIAERRARAAAAGTP